MCAVVGALLFNQFEHENKMAAQELLTFICNASTERGRDGLGTVFISNAEERWHTNIRKNPTFVAQHSLGTITRDRAVFLANMRAEPTTEYVKAKRAADQQPYNAGKWFVVHNGTIANDQQLRTLVGTYKVDTRIDSAAIPELLDSMGNDATTFYMAIQALVGSYAILAYNSDKPNSMFAATNYRPLWYVETPFGVFFASSRSYFPARYNPQMIAPYSAMEITYDKTFGLRFLRRSTHKTDATAQSVLAVCSGGLDSVVAAAKMKQQGYAVTLLHFQYGSRAEGQELDRIKKVAEHLDMPLIVKAMPGVWDVADSNLLNPEATVAGGEQGAEFAHEWVPARNLVMLAMATAYAEAKGYGIIALGNNLEEAGAYPDNEPEFINKFNDLLPFAVGDGKRVRVVMPVGNMMKHEIVALGLAINAPLHLTWSCYKNGELHCGTCGPCFMRRTAFEINNANEVIEYEQAS